MFDLNGHITIVTGGASGVGEGGTRAFAEAGATVVIADLAADRAETLAEELTSAGANVSSHPTDVTNTASVQNLVAETVRRFGRVDALFHCAADAAFINSSDRRVTELSQGTWDRMIDLHLTGTFRVLSEVGREMVKRQSGSIVLCGTVDAMVGVAGFDSYTAAKGGVLAMTRSAATGLARDGVRVNMVSPSFVDTEGQQAWLDDPGAREVIEGMHLLGIPKPIDVGRFAAFLVSPATRFVTGGVFPVDSGYTAFKAQSAVSDAMGTVRVDE